MKYLNFLAKGQSNGVVIADGAGTFAQSYVLVFGLWLYGLRKPERDTRLQHALDFGVQEDEGV